MLTPNNDMVISNYWDITIREPENQEPENNDPEEQENEERTIEQLEDEIVYNVVDRLINKENYIAVWYLDNDNSLIPCLVCMRCGHRGEFNSLQHLSHCTLTSTNSTIMYTFNDPNLNYNITSVNVNIDFTQQLVV